MELPLAEEIRETRRLAAEATDAAVHLGRIRGVLNTLALLDRQLSAHPTMKLELPGDQVVEELSERWASLSDLAAVGPRPTQNTRERLRLRRQQMEGAQQLLWPLARRQSALADEVHRLQHEQRHLLEDPKYAEAVAELGVISTERDQLAQRLEPLNHRVETMGSLKRLAGTFLDRIDHVLANTDVRPEVAPLRAATVAGGLLEALYGARDAMQVEIDLPARLELPTAFDRADEEELSDEVARIRGGLVDALEAIEAEISAHQEEVDALKQRFEAIHQQLLDRMG